MPTEDTTMFDQVAEVIERLRPFLLRDGGDCSLIDVEDGIVKLLITWCMWYMPKFYNHS